VVRGFLSFLLDSLVPVSCVACGRGIDGEDGAPPSEGAAARRAFDPGGLHHELFAGIRMPARILCAECWRSLDRSPAGASLPVEGGGASVPLVSPFYTNDALLAVVRFLKFSGGRSAVPPLAWWMAHALRARLERPAGAGCAEAVLVPVPLHPRRLRERGYNQAFLLARGVGKALGLPVEGDALARARNTRSQSKLENDDRARNVRGAFTLVRPDLVAGRTIVLVDDLVTTGGTARACLDALFGADPASAAVLAAGRAGDAGSGTRA
jgi:ComF family protein